MVMLNRCQIITILTTVLGISVLYWNSVTLTPTVKQSDITFSIRTFDRPREISAKQFSINTPGCKIQQLDPYHPSIKPFFRKHPQNFNCIHPFTSFTVSGTRIKLKRSNEFTNCAYSPIVRTAENAFQIGKSVMINMTGETKISDEFIKVQCYKNNLRSYEDYFAFIQKKPEVGEKRNGQLSVLILGLDSTSKSQYTRLLKRTDKFLRQNLSYIEFHGYHKVGLNTFPNLVPFFTGKPEKEYNVDFHKVDMNILPLAWKEFSRQGYRTLLAEDAPNIATFNYLKKGFKDQPVQYYLRPFSLAVEKSDAIRKSRYGCLNSRAESSIILKWIEDFFDEYPSDPLFAFTFLSRLTHDDFSGAEFHDKVVEEFLKALHDKGHLNRTIVFFLSDHGFRYGLVRMTYVGHMEDKLPFNFMLLPSWFCEAHPQLCKNLQTNTRRLVTPFDMHRTLLDIATDFVNVTAYNWTERSVSVFSEISDKRDCQVAGIESQYCTCTERQQVSLTDRAIAKISAILLAYINSLTVAYRSICSVFKITEVVDVTSQKMLMDDNEVSEVYAINYQVTVQVNPGDAIFQGTIWYNGKNESYHVEANVDRLTKYGNQSDCVDRFELRPFCFCKE